MAKNRRTAKALSIRAIIMGMSPLCVCGHNVDVEIVNANGIESDPSTWGCFIPQQSKIILDGRQTDSTLTATFLHEVIHAVLFHQAIQLPEEVEEQLVRVITAGLFSTFMANPRILGTLAICEAQSSRERRG